jgi:ABC-type transport system involved in multi-copper enzyme maturation permease subunit
MSTVTPYRSGLRAGRDGFGRLVRAEWTKFRTVRGWVAGVVAAALVTVLLGLLYATASHSSCSVGPVEVACPTPPLGPDGEAVDDRFYFVHRSLAGDGDLTVRVTSMTGIITYPPPDHDEIVPGVVPWAKAGIIVKESTKPGSAYAAMMVTGDHGVRMQYDFTHDVAGRPGGVSARAPRWLRLTRSGDTITGYESADGTRWTEVGTTRLAGLRGTVQVGLFVNSPGDLTLARGSLGGSVVQARFTQTTAVFDQVRLRGGSGGAWSRDEVGDGPGQTDWERYHRAAGLVESGGTYTVSGSGDIAPSTDGQAVERTLTGALAGLITVMVVAAMFVTAEYRRGLIRTTLLAGPRRGRALAAKAVVIGTVAFAAGLAAAGISVVAGTYILRANGNFILPVASLTAPRVIVGTGALFAAAAVFALALGALFRRSVAAVTTAIAAIVLPYLLAGASVLPLGVAQWLLRLTPAAGFAIQQSVPEYPQVLNDYAPAAGYYPLAPWAGLAVLCGYALVALALAVVRLRRRDA